MTLVAKVLTKASAGVNESDPQYAKLKADELSGGSVRIKSKGDQTFVGAKISSSGGTKIEGGHIGLLAAETIRGLFGGKAGLITYSTAHL